MTPTRLATDTDTDTDTDLLADTEHCRVRMTRQAVESFVWCNDSG